MRSTVRRVLGLAAVVVLLPGCWLIGSSADQAAPPETDRHPVGGGVLISSPPPTSSTIASADVVPAAFAAPSADGCTDGSHRADALAGVFSRPLAGIAGADYLHAYPLPDGRTFWLMQDAYVGTSDDENADHLVHNAGLVESNGCFTALYHGTPDAPSSYVGWARETPLSHWFWPLDGAIGADGDLHVYFHEMTSMHGTGASMGAGPVGTWLARFDVRDLHVVSFTKVTDANEAQFGWAVTDDGTWTYLFSYCNRQFDFGGSGLNSCTSTADVARIPLGRFGAAPEYLTVGGWSANPVDLAAVVSSDTTAALSIERLGSRWVAVTKDLEWFGSTITVRAADQPSGPWRIVGTVPVTPSCTGCVTYSARLLPWLDAGRPMIALSSNTSPEREQHDASRYRTTFMTLDAPGLRVDG